MRIHILTDLHLEFHGFLLPDPGADVLVLAGDIHTRGRAIPWLLEQANGRPVIYVLGNHEYYEGAYPKLLHKMQKKAKGTTIHVLEDEALTIGDVTFIGSTLWTDLKLFGDPGMTALEITKNKDIPDYREIRLQQGENYRKFLPEHTKRIHETSMSFITNALNGNGKKVVVTHHAPSMRSVPDRYRKDITTAVFASNLESFAESGGAKLWIHGHLHDSSDYQIGKTRVICNPRGYAPKETNPEFDPEMVVEV